MTNYCWSGSEKGVDSVVILLPEQGPGREEYGAFASAGARASVIRALHASPIWFSAMGKR